MAPRKPKGIDWNSNLSDFKDAVLNTPERAAKNLFNVAKSTPLGIATQTAVKGANTYKNKGYKAAVTEQAKIAGIQIGSEIAGNVAGKVVGKAVSSAAPTIAKAGSPEIPCTIG